MDLIGNIKYIENRLGGRKSNHDKEKLAQKNARINTEGEKKDQADTNHFPAENGSMLGRKVDTTA